MEAGAAPVQDHQNDDGDKLVIAYYGLAFATAIILKRLLNSASSVRLRSCALGFEDSSSVLRALQEVSWFNVGYVARQLKDHAAQLRNLDLDICYYKVDPFNSGSPSEFASSAAYYIHVFNNLRNLTIYERRRSAKHPCEISTMTVYTLTRH